MAGDMQLQLTGNMGAVVMTSTEHRYVWHQRDCHGGCWVSFVNALVGRPGSALPCAFAYVLS